MYLRFALLKVLGLYIFKNLNVLALKVHVCHFKKVLSKHFCSPVSVSQQLRLETVVDGTLL